MHRPNFTCRADSHPKVLWLFSMAATVSARTIVGGHSVLPNGGSRRYWSTASVRADSRKCATVVAWCRRRRGRETPSMAPPICEPRLRFAPARPSKPTPWSLSATPMTGHRQRAARVGVTRLRRMGTRCRWKLIPAPGTRSTRCLPLIPFAGHYIGQDPAAMADSFIETRAFLSERLVPARW